MKILESAENYLETIFMLKKQFGEVRSIDIVNHLNFSKPSISTAMKHLKENNYIEINKSGYITLTKKGLEIASAVCERHYLLTKFLTSIGVSEDVALEDACKIEHYISDESYEKLKAHMLNVTE